jgi:hypothetical protein
MDMSELGDLVEDEQAKETMNRLEHFWDEEVKRNPKSPSILRVMFKTHKNLFISSGIWFVLWTGFLFLQITYLMNQLIVYSSNPDAPVWQGYVFAISFFLCSICTSLSINVAFFLNVRTGVRVF